MKKMLVAYDGSESAKRALDRAIELRRPGDRIDVIGVLPLDGTDGVAPATRSPLDDARATLAEHGIPGEVLTEGGEPGVAICHAVSRAGYDLLLVGSRRFNVLERAVLGSVSSWVAHHADCDVLIVR